VQGWGSRRLSSTLTVPDLPAVCCSSSGICAAGPTSPAPGFEAEPISADIFSIGADDLDAALGLVLLAPV
jgi:hypothetical protein